ncbi:MAG: hypothetical protein C0399_12215 [Syntrophus sp. (in: bacteria)]|nr:hypothetical protein [Syntrophus sp. (in: bacteria)]MBA4419075.1 hypothetical protein [Syntrophus sp. (in: bacteria)]
MRFCWNNITGKPRIRVRTALETSLKSATILLNIPATVFDLFSPRTIISRPKPSVLKQWFSSKPLAKPLNQPCFLDEL